MIKIKFSIKFTNFKIIEALKQTWEVQYIIKTIIKEKTIRDKLKMGELMAKASFMEKKHPSRYEAENLECEE